MNNNLNLNVEIEQNENEIINLNKIEYFIYNYIEKSLNFISLEYLKNNDIKLRKYNISISYNIYNNSIQFYDNNNNYLKNIRYLLLKYDFKKVTEYIINEIDKYFSEYCIYLRKINIFYNDLINMNIL